MVCVVVLRGSDLVRAEKRLRRASNGFQEIDAGVWVVSGDLDASELRDYIGDGISIRVFAVELTGRWATKGWSDVAAWMRSSRDAF